MRVHWEQKNRFEIKIHQVCSVSISTSRQWFRAAKSSIRQREKNFLRQQSKQNKHNVGWFWFYMNLSFHLPASSCPSACSPQPVGPPRQAFTTCLSISEWVHAWVSERVSACVRGQTLTDQASSCNVTEVKTRKKRNVPPYPCREVSKTTG